MIIESSQLLLDNQYQFNRQKVVKESLVEGFNRAGQVWSVDNLQRGFTDKLETINLYDKMGKLTSGKTQFTNTTLTSNTPQNLSTPIRLTGASASITFSESKQDAPPVQLSPRMQLMINLIEYMTGKKIKLIDNRPVLKNEATDIPTSDISSNNLPVSEYGSRYEYSENVTEQQSSQFTAQGVIMTTDGMRIEIDLELNMSRFFNTNLQININKGAAVVKDPLVINFTDKGVQLNDEKFEFDIDVDGTKENISLLSPDSGFLALDRNNDGLINNGSELFGAISGNGFAELAEYDTDNNQFIDAGDKIYKQLKIWVHDTAGSEQLYSLKQANVAAIYLRAVDTPFDLKTSNNELSAIIRSGGLYLTENGQSKSVQQIDLVI
jgi:hypothetical protein